MGNSNLKSLYEFVNLTSKERNNKLIREIIIYAILLTVFSLFAVLSIKQISLKDKEIKRLKNNNGALTSNENTTRHQNPTLMSSEDTLVSKNWLHNVLSNTVSERKVINTIKGDGSQDYSITFNTSKTTWKNSKGDYIFSIEPEPSQNTNNIKEIVYSSTDEEFKDHILKSTNAGGNNFFIEWEAKTEPHYLILTIKYRDCNTEVLMLDYKKGKLTKN